MDKNTLIDTLSPLERTILANFNKDLDFISKKLKLDKVSIIRGMKLLEAKGIVSSKNHEKQLIDLGINGIYYKKNHLPERRLIIYLENSNLPSLDEAQKKSKLTENEFKVSLGVLKSKNLISLVNGKIQLIGSKEELTKKMKEEHLLESLPIKFEELPIELKQALEQLKKRKDIIEIKTETISEFELTDLGKSIDAKNINSELLEEVTPEMIKLGVKGKKFRRYDLSIPVQKIYPGRKHFVNQSLEYARRIWTDLGFKEMTGNSVETSFWVFDALFTPQDHQAREMQDTFFIKNVNGKLPDKKLVDAIKKSHEIGVSGSKGWKYNWNPEVAKKIVLRTHTTSLSAKTLANLKKEDLPAKYFAIGKVFRNETVDWNHGFEFYQSEGIVIDENANLRHLLGYLKTFYKKMGFEKIKFVPSFFPYTEPSVEIQVFHPVKKTWVELGGAGIFRPEVTQPLLGHSIPVLAWGQGFDRIIRDYYNIIDLRELYSNDIKELRNKKEWIK